MGATANGDPVIGFGRAGFVNGLGQGVPWGISSFLFGLAYGPLALKGGLSLAEALIMSAVVYAGTSQLVALQLWGWPLPVFALVFAAFAVNARHILMGVALRPWFGRLPLLKAYGSLFFLSDGNWSLAMREYHAGRRDGAFLLGVGVVMYGGWLAGSAVGYGAGTFIGDPKAWGLDFMLVGFAVPILSGIRRGRADLLPWAVAGTVAVATSLLLPGYAHVLLGALAGSIVGALARVGRP
ncbi:MAG: AzlC family ABC transporter permease [Proteobacteria bacterium]|nr:AzlC family ABC transporter permease [Pseudomonadota bacterium]MBI3497505.1 AzlC family ABC transporter permease [Pseudomonadota bacterium]